MLADPGWYFSAPWDPVPVRRGDALGLRAGADSFAELLAPGLSNATSDARWISLLSWCLYWSHTVWKQAGGGDLSRRDGQRARYAWLRPLELLWVARTLASEQKTGQLRGRRSVQRWLDALADGQRLPNFAMTADQFHRYRQVGSYGAYRVVFRMEESKLTTGDGWTPGDTALSLARLVNDELPRGARLDPRRFENGTKWGHWSDREEEARYWIEQGWPAWQAPLGGVLPTPDRAVRARLPPEERALLEPALFGAGSRRRATVEVLAQAKGARSHAELCDALAGASELARRLAPASLAPLPAFSRLADAAMNAMRGLWDALNHDDAPQVAIERLTRRADLQARLDALPEAADGWLRAPRRSTFRHEAVVTQLAEAIRDAGSPGERLRALVTHHQEHGGGRRWFRAQGDQIAPLIGDSGIPASDYRFRLSSLCRLAAQCGVADLDHALDAIAGPEAEDEDGE